MFVALYVSPQVSAQEHMAAADMALRHVAHALLVGVEEKQVSEHALQVKLLTYRVGPNRTWDFHLLYMHRKHVPYDCICT
jgi:hypothetical protein